MCDRIVLLSQKDIKNLIIQSISDSYIIPSEISYNIKKKICLDGKCDYKATSYVLDLIKDMLKREELIPTENNNALILNSNYVFENVIEPEPEELDTSTKYIISGKNEIKLSRTEYFFSAWSSVYIGQKIDVILVPEPNNPVDKKAIAVFFSNKQIGYLPGGISTDLYDEIWSKNQQGFIIVTQAEVIKQAMMGTKNCLLFI